MDIGSLTWATLAVLALSGCSHSTASNPGNDLSQGVAADLSGDLATTSGNPGTITGTVAGKTFGTVMTALWIDGTDTATNAVVYVFDKTTACGDISAAGWDVTGPLSSTQHLEMKTFNQTPATFTVVTHALGAGQANASYTFGAGGDTVGTAGTVTLASLVAGGAATGSFDVTSFGSTANHLSGTFDAVFCSTGVEP